MNVSLTPELEKLVQEKVASGLYSSASEVVRASLRLLQARDQLRAEQIDQVRNKLTAGLSSLDNGEGIPAAKVFTDLKKRAARQKRPKRA